MAYRDCFRGARCLVMGGLGFTGSTVASALVDLSAVVHIVDSLVERNQAGRASLDPELSFVPMVRVFRRTLRLLRHVDLPFGLTPVALARKPQ